MPSSRGFKLWECASDLVGFLKAESEKKVDPLKLAGARVAELGCGHALPGIYCLQQGAAQVALQDLNVEVLAHCTAPNVLLNTGEFSTGSLNAWCRSDGHQLARSVGSMHVLQWRLGGTSAVVANGSCVV